MAEPAGANVEPRPSPPTVDDSVEDISLASGAQVALNTFNFPDFPLEAAGLRALTLTSDVKTDEYQQILAQRWSVTPTLPSGIESLTLELFSMGFPPGFLAELADQLPNLKSLVVYSQLLAGITEESKADAVKFFEKQKNLRALHLLDTFSNAGFIRSIAPYLRREHPSSDARAEEAPAEAPEERKGLMFLEVNYTYRHEDETFLDKILANELPDLVGPDLISCSFNIAPGENASDDPDDPTTIRETGHKEGIMAFNKSLAADVVGVLTEEATRPRALKALNATLYTLTLEDLKTVLTAQRGIMVLSVTVEMDTGEEQKRALLEALQLCPLLEQVEIVCNPTLQFFMAVQDPRRNALARTYPSVDDMEALTEKCPNLSGFRADILRTRSFGWVEWEKENGKWCGGVKGVKEIPSHPDLSVVELPA